MVALAGCFKKEYIAFTMSSSLRTGQNAAQARTSKKESVIKTLLNFPRYSGETKTKKGEKKKCVYK